MSNDPLWSSILPIVYAGGTGGHFLAALLRNARLNNKGIQFELSEYGNCHSVKVDIGSFGGFDYPLEKKIDKLRQCDIKSNTVYYWPLHSNRFANVIEKFNRSIKITYTESDIPEIAAIFYIKWGIEGGHTNVQYLPGRFEPMLRDSIRCFSPEETYGDRVLNVSWHEIFRSNVDDIVNTLSAFTGMASENFDKEFIIEWRRRTILGLSKIGNQYS